MGMAKRVIGAFFLATEIPEFFEKKTRNLCGLCGLYTTFATPNQIENTKRGHNAIP
jgi:hypothetical protein